MSHVEQSGFGNNEGFAILSLSQCNIVTIWQYGNEYCHAFSIQIFKIFLPFSADIIFWASFESMFYLPEFNSKQKWSKLHRYRTNFEYFLKNLCKYLIFGSNIWSDNERQWRFSNIVIVIVQWILRNMAMTLSLLANPERDQP